MEQVVHMFEVAGLGTAPFTFAHVIHGDWDNCQYCQHPIKERCYVKDANGKLFYVGNECINQTDDTGLINTAKEKLKEHRKQLKYEREAKQIREARLLLYFYPEFKERYLKEVHYFLEPSLTKFIRDRLDRWQNSWSNKLRAAKSVLKFATEILPKDTLTHYLNENTLENAEWKLNEELRLEKEAARLEMEHWQAERAAKQAQIAEDNQYLIDILEPMSATSGFAKDIARQLKYSELKEFTPRQIEVMADIYGKTFGNRNTEAYKEAYREVYEKGILPKLKEGK